MQRNEHTLEIDAPPETVWQWLVEPDRLPQWIGGMRSFEPLTEGGPRQGARSRERVEVAGRVWETETEIAEFEPNRRLGLHSRHKHFEARSTYTLADEGGRTRLTAEVEADYKARLAYLLGGLVKRHAQRKLEGDLERLKQLAES